MISIRVIDGARETFDRAAAVIRKADEPQGVLDRSAGALVSRRRPRGSGAGPKVMARSSMSTPTQVRVHELASLLVAAGKARGVEAVYEQLWAADRLAVAAMWLTVHMTYARNVYPGRACTRAPLCGGFGIGDPGTRGCIHARWLHRRCAPVCALVMQRPACCSEYARSIESKWARRFDGMTSLDSCQRLDRRTL